MNSDNNLIEINDDNVLMEFNIDDQTYVVLGEDNDDIEEINVYFAKKNYVDDGISIVRNIESDEEYALVIKKYEEIMNSFDDVDGDGEYV